MVRPILVAVAVTLAQLAAAPGVLAQSAEQRAAIAAFDQGDRLAAAGRWSEACARYTESQRFDPQLGALLHVADCNERIGKLATAWGAFREATRIAEQRGDARLQVARERAAALEPRVARLQLSMVRPDAALAISLDGTRVAVGETGAVLALDAGEHTLRAEAPAREPWTRSVRIADGARERVRVPELQPVRALASAGGTVPTAVPTAALAPDAPPEPGATQRTWGWIAIGAGAAAAIATGALFALQDDRGDEVYALKREYERMLCAGCAQNDSAAQEYERMKAPLVDEQERLRGWSIATGVASGALIVGGITLLLTAPDQKEAVQLALVPDSRRGQLLLRGSFSAP
jgi:hypothetical protein